MRVIFPNAANHPPGTKLRFRSYDPHGFGWYTLAQLTVSADGRQIASAPGVTLGEIGCTFILDPDNEAFANTGDDDEFGDPVDAASGVFRYRKTDLMVPDVIPVVLRPTPGPSRTTRATSSRSRTPPTRSRQR